MSVMLQMAQQIGKYSKFCVQIYRISLSRLSSEIGKRNLSYDTACSQDNLTTLRIFASYRVYQINHNSDVYMIVLLISLFIII